MHIEYGKFRQCQNRRNFRVGGMHIHCCHDAGNTHRYAYHCGNQSSVAGGSGIGGGEENLDVGLGAEYPYNQ